MSIRGQSVPAQQMSTAGRPRRESGEENVRKGQQRRARLLHPLLCLELVAEEGEVSEVLVRDAAGGGHAVDDYVLVQRQREEPAGDVKRLGPHAGDGRAGEAASGGVQDPQALPRADIAAGHVDEVAPLLCGVVGGGCRWAAAGRDVLRWIEVEQAGGNAEKSEVGHTQGRERRLALSSHVCFLFSSYSRQPGAASVRTTQCCGDVDMTWPLSVSIEMNASTFLGTPTS